MVYNDADEQSPVVGLPCGRSGILRGRDHWEVDGQRRSPKRAGIIEISAVGTGKEIIYKVTDNGIGIALEHQPKVFEIFHRLNPGDSEGEGLGLTIAQNIVERPNSRIWVESELDKGSSFFVALPAAAG